MRTSTITAWITALPTHSLCARNKDRIPIKICAVARHRKNTVAPTGIRSKSICRFLLAIRVITVCIFTRHIYHYEELIVTKSTQFV